jgi:hypothetical protein
MSETFTNGAFSIEKHVDGNSLSLTFSGKSILDDPVEFVLPVLTDALTEADESGARLVLDFRNVSYMNSSTYAPLVRILHKARLASSEVSVVYSGAVRWQEVSFSALNIFQTRDGRIEITGAADGE